RCHAHAPGPRRGPRNSHSRRKTHEYSARINIMSSLKGSFRAFFFYDISEEISLDSLRALLGAGPPGREPPFRHPTPSYVGFGPPPVMERLGEFSVGGQSFYARIRFFDYAIASLELERLFDTEWPELIELPSRYIGAPEIERAALE